MGARVFSVRVAHPPHVRRAAVHPEDAEAFLAGHRIAVIGASEDTGNMGRVIVRELWRHGHEVVPVHPTALSVEGHPCHPTIAAVPDPVDGAIVVVPAVAAVDVVRQCIDTGVRSIWLFKGIGGEGAVCDEAVELCRANDVAVVAGACPLMFIRPVGSIHRFHRAARRVRGTLAHQAS